MTKWSPTVKIDPYPEEDSQMNPLESQPEDPRETLTPKELAEAITNQTRGIYLNRSRIYLENLKGNRRISLSNEEEDILNKAIDWGNCKRAVKLEEVLKEANPKPENCEEILTETYHRIEAFLYIIFRRLTKNPPRSPLAPTSYFDKKIFDHFYKNVGYETELIFSEIWDELEDNPEQQAAEIKELEELVRNTINLLENDPSGKDKLQSLINSTFNSSDWRAGKDLLNFINKNHTQIKDLKGNDPDGNPVDFWARYLTMMTCGNRYNSKSYDPESEFPAKDLKSFEAELRGLDYFHPAQEEIMKLSKIVSQDGGASSFLEAPPLNKGEKATAYKKFYWRVWWNRMREKNVSPSEIKSALITLDEVTQSNFLLMGSLVEHWPTIQLHFPNGEQGFLQFYQELASYVTFRPMFFVEIAESCENAPKEPNVKNLFWKTGLRVMKYLREGSVPYADYQNWSPVLQDKLKNDPVAFDAIIERALGILFKFNSHLARNCKEDRDIFRCYLKHYGDANFEAYEEAILYLAREIAEFMENDERLHQKNNRGKCLESVFKMLNIFIEQLQEIPPNILEIAQKLTAEHLDQAAPSESNLEKLRLTHQLRMGNGASKDVPSKLRALVEITTEPSAVDQKALSALRLEKWREIITILPSDEAIATNPIERWLDQAKPSTRMAVTGGSLWLATGLPDPRGNLFELNGLKSLWETPLLPKPTQLDFENGRRPLSEFMEEIERSGLEEPLHRRIQEARHHIARSIQEQRMSILGLMAVGSKVESASAMKQGQFRLALDLARDPKRGEQGELGTTGFKLKHNNRSLVCPATPSAFEQKLLLHYLAVLGVIDLNNLDLQVTMGGQLDNNMAGVVAASSILSSYASFQYQAGAFIPDFGETECRMMIKDAGVRAKGMPFDLLQAIGRTDKVANKTMLDMRDLQVVGTCAVHQNYDGLFKDLMNTFTGHFIHELGNHRHANLALSEWLTLSRWIAPAPFDDPMEHHEEMVAAFTIARRDNPKLVKNVRALIQQGLINPLTRIKNDLQQIAPKEVLSLQNY